MVHLNSAFVMTSGSDAMALGNPMNKRQSIRALLA